MDTEANDIIIDMSQLVLIEVEAYYSANPDKFKKFVDIKNNNGRSLREIQLMVSGIDNKYYPSYQKQLKNYGKLLFDPFCRTKHKFNFKGIDTSIGQLNFFKWLFENNLVN